MLLVLLAFVAFKLTLLMGYVAKYHGLRGPLVRWSAFSDQIEIFRPVRRLGSALRLARAGGPMGGGGALPGRRCSASFSIAAVLAPLVNLFRVSINAPFLPSMSRLQAAGDIAGMIELNNRANVLVGALLFPLLAFVFASPKKS